MLLTGHLILYWDVIKIRKGVNYMKNMKMKSQLELLNSELVRTDMSQERIQEIKRMTVCIAKTLDAQNNVNYFEGLVEDIYRKKPVPKFFKSRVKKVVNELLKYVA